MAPLVAKFREKNAAYIEENKTQQIIADVIASDRACVRFLFARGSDLEKASIMLKEATEYRKKMKTDEILDAPFPLAAQIKQNYHHCYHGFDKEGRPVYYEQTGMLDIPLLTKLWTPEQMLSYHTHNTEYNRRVLFPAASVRAGKKIDQLCSIIDLNGLGRHHLTKTAYGFLSSVSKVDQLIYPEVLGRMVIINAGFVFSIAWAIIKPWLEERTKSKISITRGDGKEELLKYIDAEQLPRQFGGKCGCGLTTAEPPKPITSGCIINSPDTANWLAMSSTGLETQLKAHAAAAAVAPAATAPVDTTPLPSAAIAPSDVPVAVASSEGQPAPEPATPTTAVSPVAVPTFGGAIVQSPEGSEAVTAPLPSPTDT